MTPREQLLAALVVAPDDATAWLALADCLEEEGEPERGELLRLQLALHRTPDDRPGRPRTRRRQLERRAQELLAAGVRPCVPTLTFELPGPVPLELALIPAGSFMMGAKGRESGRFIDEKPRRLVTLTRPFYLGVYPLTQAQWFALTRRRPARFRGKARPVEQVCADDCEGYCRALGQRVGRVVRLPTEAEWECACRAGTTTEFASGDGEEAMGRAGWCDLDRTRAVGLKQPNGWGLYDMHGNVWEWCLDAYDLYQGEDLVDPLATGPDHALRVARGGSYSNPPQVCRSACRIGFAGGGRNDFIGCRLVVEWQPASGAA